MTPFVTRADRLRFPEGPISLAGGDVLVVEIAGQALTRVRPDGTLVEIAHLEGGPNGAALGDDGQVYVCNSGGWRYEQRGVLTWPVGTAERTGWLERVDLATGAHEVLYDRCGDHELRSPNDLVLDGAGGCFFTDIGKRNDRSLDWTSVYWARLDGSEIREVIHPILTPNGCGLSPDGSTLYVAETFTGRLWAFDVIGPGELRPGTGPAPHGGRLVAGVDGYRLFDSLAVHADGDVCVATLFDSGITVCDPAGGETAFVSLPDPYTTNVCFDADGADVAYVTLSSSGRLVELDWSAAVAVGRVASPGPNRGGGA